MESGFAVPVDSDCGRGYGHAPRLRGDGMSRWVVRFDDVTTLYEVHAEGCRHLQRKRFNGSASSLSVLDSVSGSVAAERFEAANDGCVTRLAPCAVG